MGLRLGEGKPSTSTVIIVWVCIIALGCFIAYDIYEKPIGNEPRFKIEQVEIDIESVDSYVITDLQSYKDGKRSRKDAQYLYTANKSNGETKIIQLRR